MQIQDNFQFYQELLAHFYRFTLENGVYATCLAISVWLLTSILYSISINSLNKRNRISLKATDDAVNALLAAREQIQALESELDVSKKTLEQEMRRGADLLDRINEIAVSLTESISALAAEADLGQQGLSVKEGLQAEQLWQRYSIAVKQICENLLAEKKNNNELKQAYSSESAKVSERDMQLQVAQIRADGQKQQIAKLELLVEEHKAQLEQQQESAKLRLAALETRHQAELDKLAALQPRTYRSTVKEFPSEIQENSLTGAQTVEQIKPVETLFAASVSSVPKPESGSPNTEQAINIDDEIKIEQYVSTNEPPKQKSAKSTGFGAGLGGKLKGFMGSSKKAGLDSVRNDAAEEPSETLPVKPSKTAAVSATPKSKSMFAGFRGRIDKLDKLLGQEAPVVIAEEEAGRLERTYEEPQAVKKAAVESVRTYETKIASGKSSETLPVETVKPLKTAAVGAAPKSKSMFAGFRERIDKLDKMLGQETPMISEEESDLSSRTYEQPEPVARNVEFSVTVAEPAVNKTTKETATGLGGKFKTMLGGSKKTVSESAIADSPVVELQPQPVESPRAKKAGLNKLFGKFKK